MLHCKRAGPDLDKVAASRVHRLEQVRVAQYNHIRADANCRPQLIMQPTMRLGLRRPVIINQPPQVCVLRHKGPREAPQGVRKVRDDRFSEQKHGGQDRNFEGQALAIEPGQPLACGTSDAHCFFDMPL